MRTLHRLAGAQISSTTSVMISISDASSSTVTLQVFGGQQVDGGHLDAGFLAPAQHLGDLAGTHPVAVADVVVTSITCPASVTVAQHRDVAGQFGFGGRQSLTQPHLVEPIHRFLETRGNDVHERSRLL